MERQRPDTTSNEIELYIRTYYSVLRSTGEVRVRSVVRGGPAYVSGLDRRDVVRELGGHAIRSEVDLVSATATFAPGDSAEIVFDKRGEERKARIVFEQNPRVQVIPFERAGRAVTPEIEAFRDAWLASKR